MQSGALVDVRSTQHRLSEEARRLRELAEAMPVPAARELINEASRLESKAKLERWLSSPELKPPR